MGSLVPKEPRLARKLLEPLATIIQNTQAKSLQYECIHTLTLALAYTKKADGTDAKNASAVVSLCSDHLKQFIDDPDQNLKYLGLVGFVELMKSHPKAVIEHKEPVLLCLADEDVTIRTRALELLAGMITRKSLPDLVSKLLEHVTTAEGGYRDELIAKIIEMCSRDKYAHLADFHWYLNVLIKLAHLRGTRHASLIADQFIDVSIRVKPVRRDASKEAVRLLFDESLLKGQSLESIAAILSASAWIAGEYISILICGQTDDDDDADDEEHDEDTDDDRGEDLVYAALKSKTLRETLVDLLMAPSSMALPESVQSVYLQTCLKVVAEAATNAQDQELEAILNTLCERIDFFLRSAYMEVQDRAALVLGTLETFEIFVNRPVLTPGNDVLSSTVDRYERGYDLPSARRSAVKLSELFTTNMGAVNPVAQSVVPVPESLEPLDAEPDLSLLVGAEIAKFVSNQSANAEFVQEQIRKIRFVEDPNDRFFSGEREFASGSDDDDPMVEESEPYNGDTFEERNSDRAAMSDPFYLRETSVDPAQVDVDDVPVVRLTDADLKPAKKKKGTKKKRKVAKAEIDTSDLMPEGAALPTTKKESTSKNKTPILKDPFSIDDLAAIDITTPLRDDEVMPTIEHRVSAGTTVTRKNESGLLVSETIMPSTTETKKNKPKKEKKKKLSSAATVTQKPSSKSTGDLLDLLDFGEEAPALSRSSSNSFPTMDLLGGEDFLSGSNNETKITIPQEPSVKKKAIQTKHENHNKTLFLPLQAQASLISEYAVCAKKLYIRLRNIGTSDLYSSGSVAIESPLVHPASVSAFSSLESGNSVSVSFDFELGDAQPPIILKCRINYFVEGLIAEPASINTQIRIPIGAFLTSSPTTPDQLAQILTTASDWTSNSVKIGGFLSIDQVASFLNATVVERGADDASASMLAHARRNPSNKIAFLIKRLSSGKKFKLDFKSNESKLATALYDDLSDHAKKFKSSSSSSKSPNS
eukprot:CAMPEP_0197320650 /NCGR_PEP_ID=MMETSP0891-20130614/61103_1 /TAXON_ID=44058 ORGANISM="Aureoumbra lagunensis, Strain CCMP1510" /NCGR_SAMPLE_ID=MMETSP0891 /ASSEMBLY_ACC=CAM_ASM_000534 /LENGTH=986 /DNA_ID=CAMNT_0042812153 /DNA_START=725 /DNA_END=3685 /DNA_ORIENTATION=+